MSIKLADDLEYWRVERPDEWKMDEFIRNAVRIENENEVLRAILTKIVNEAKSFEERTGGSVSWLEDANKVLGE